MCHLILKSWTALTSAINSANHSTVLEGAYYSHKNNKLNYNFTFYHIPSYKMPYIITSYKMPVMYRFVCDNIYLELAY